MTELINKIAKEIAYGTLVNVPFSVEDLICPFKKKQAGLVVDFLKRYYTQEQIVEGLAKYIECANEFCRKLHEDE